MQAIWLANQKLSFREDVPLPQVKPGEALIRVHLAGICATDLELLRGYYPYDGIPGHEFVGTVVEVNHPDPAAQVWQGRRVVGEINAWCGECATCLRGHPTHCENRTTLGIVNRNGAFAEFLALPVKNLHAVPDHVSDEMAVFTEPLAAALEIQQQITIHPADHVLVVGAGRLGQLIAQTLALTGCKLWVVARHPRQRTLLAVNQIQTIEENDIPQAKMDIVVEASGSPFGFSLAVQAVRPRGIIVLKSTHKANLDFNITSIVVNEITLVGSRCGKFTPALKLLAEGTINLLPLIEALYPIQDGIKAFTQAAQPGVLKILLELQ